MFVRLLSILFLAPIAIGAIWMGGWSFSILVAVGGLLAVWEWCQMCSVKQNGGRFLVCLIVGTAYITIPCALLVWMRNDPESGRIFVFWFFCVIWATDIGAYLFGKTIGGPKLAPRISPNKTWAGLIGGIVSAMLVSWALIIWHGDQTALLEVILFGAILAITGQIGDLIESWAKRYFEVKDSGAIIPGHGGILDRVDAILLAAPVATGIRVIFGIGTF